MDRTVEPQNASGGPAAAEEPHQQPPREPAEASSSQQPVQPAPAVAQPSGLGTGPRPPPKTESDRAFRASRAPISRPLSPATEGHYEDASDRAVGYASPREQSMRRSGAPLLQSPSPTRGQPGAQVYYAQGADRLPVAPPPTAPPNSRRRSSALDWVLPRAEKSKVYVVSDTFPSIYPLR